MHFSSGLSRQGPSAVRLGHFPLSDHFWSVTCQRRLFCGLSPQRVSGHLWGRGRKWYLTAPVLIFWLIPLTQGAKGRPPPTPRRTTAVLLPVFLSWVLQKQEGFAKNNFSNCLLLLLFFETSRVRAESQGFGIYNKPQGFGTNKRDGQRLPLFLALEGLGKVTPLSGLFIVNPRVLKSTPSTRHPSSFSTLQVVRLFFSTQWTRVCANSERQ